MGLIFTLGTLDQVLQGDGEHFKETLGRPPPWPPPYEASKSVQSKLEAQSNSSTSLFRTPGTARTKMDAPVAYRVGFGRTWYGWKDNFKTLPMAPVSGLNSSESTRIVRGI